MQKTKGREQELKGLLISDWIYDFELETIRALLGEGKKKISVRASMIAQHLAKKDEDGKEDYQKRKCINQKWLISSQLKEGN